jgi:hypothetical protein
VIVITIRVKDFTFRHRILTSVTQDRYLVSSFHRLKRRRTVYQLFVVLSLGDESFPKSILHFKDRASSNLNAKALFSCRKLENIKIRSGFRGNYGLTVTTDPIFSLPIVKIDHRLLYDRRKSCGYSH